MARASTVRFGDFLVEIEGDAPNDWTAPCGLRSRGFNRSASTNENEVPDCDDESLPAVTERDIVALSAEISGAGVVDSEDVERWDDWMKSGATKRVRVSMKTGPSTFRRYIVPCKLTQLNWGAERGGRLTNEVTMQNDGEVEYPA